MRPSVILNFERLYLLAVAIELGRIILDREVLLANPAVLTTRLIVVIATVALVLLTSRRRSKIARVVLTGAFLVGLPVIADALKPSTDSTATALTLAQLGLQAAAFLLLFSQEGRRWFASGEGQSPAS